MGEESLSGLKGRMESLQAELDAAAARVEELEGQVHEVEHHMEEIDARRALLERRAERLRRIVIARADALYRTGGAGMLEMLFGSEDFSEMASRAEMLSQVSLEDQGAFVDLYRTTAELKALDEEMTEREAQLSDTLVALEEESDLLQARFREVADDYEDLQRRLAAAAPEPEVAPAPRVASVAPVARSTGGMYCPVAGPVSFVDSWGAPRAGHTHQGVDMMAAYGTPLVAIVSGTITYAAYDGSGGNMIFLSGDDGHAYWYMHNQQNLVSSGHVSAGQQIATVGDTGNAEGTPHLHFEYHPGGGSAVNPYPLVASIC